MIEDWANFLVTDKSDNRTVRWPRQEYWFIRNWSGWTFGAAIWQRKLAPCSSFYLLVHSWWKSACFVLRCLASNGSLPHCSVMFRSFFHGDFHLFWNTFCWQWGHKFSVAEWHTSLRNRVVRRRMCKITGFLLCYPFKWLLWDSSKVHSVLKYTKLLMFEMWHSMQVFCYSSKERTPGNRCASQILLYCVGVS